MSEAALPEPQPLAAVYDAAYQGVPNWDIGRPQRAFVHLEATGRVESPVLDLGCGTGELTLFLARQGYTVLGVDISEAAIRQAREKAHWRRIAARFLVWDALYLDRLADRGFRFRTVLDSAMYHILGDRERDGLVAGLTDIVEAGGRYVVLGDAPRDPRSGYGFSPPEIRERFVATGGWDLEFAIETGFERRSSTSPAYFVSLRRR